MQSCRPLHREGTDDSLKIAPSAILLGFRAADQLYACYAQGKDNRALSAIVGEEALSDTDRKFLKVAERFEKMFVKQGINEDRSIEQTLDIGWDVIAPLSDSEIKRIKPEMIEKYRRRATTTTTT